MQANYRNKQEKKQFRLYVASCVQNVNAILAEQLGGKYMSVSYAEIIEPAKIETRTSEEIIENIRQKLQNIGDK